MVLQITPGQSHLCPGNLVAIRRVGLYYALSVYVLRAELRLGGAVTRLAVSSYV